MKLTEKTQELFDYVKAHGGRVAATEAVSGLGKAKLANILGCINSLSKKGLAEYVKVDEGGEKPVAYIQLTDEGMNFVPSED